jgi:hypothetical protein
MPEAHLDPPLKAPSLLSRRFSVEPMMDWNY